MFLRQVLDSFGRRPLGAMDVSKNLHKVAAVAIVLREHPGRRNTEVLFIKRAVSHRDAWSGDVAFPGGCHDTASDGSSSFDTVCREVREEVGLDLRNSKRYTLLGTLPERTVPRGARHLTIAPFVFVDSAPTESADDYLINEKEISCIWWADADLIQENFIHIHDSYVIDVRERFLSRYSKKPLFFHSIKAVLRLLSISTVSFPCIDLTPTSDCALYFPKHQNATANLSRNKDNFALWGLTMSMFCDLVSIATGQTNQHLTVTIKYDNSLFDWHFHFWQRMGLSWKNSLNLASASYLGSLSVCVVAVATVLF